MGYSFDEKSGEASGNCDACGKPCVYTDNFGRDKCIKVIDEREQTPEVLHVFCCMDCLLDFFRRPPAADSQSACSPR